MREVTINGLRVYVVDLEQCERADFVVCSPQSYFPDDVHTTCAFCQRPIVHRPHAPAAPPKVCMPCAMSPFLLTKES